MIEPYQQGEFDALCGIYAIINAFRKVLGNDRRLPGAAWESLFSCLIEEADEKVGLTEAITEGLATMQVYDLVQLAIASLQQDHGVALDWNRPFVGRPKQTLQDVLTQLKVYTEQEFSAVLIRLGGTLGHWTVIDRIGSTYMSLVDSAGHHRVSLDRCRISYEPSLGTLTEHVVYVGAIIQIAKENPLMTQSLGPST